MKPHALLLAFAAALAVAPSAGADGCVDCHGDGDFKVTNKKLFDYFGNWKNSAHETAGVRCIDCHGGDPDAKDRDAAHAGIKHPSGEGSPLHFRNIPETCGKCHQGVKQHFTKSAHYNRLMKSGGGPNCVTCHGSMSSRTYYKTILAKACSDCHNETTKNHPEVVAEAKKIRDRLSHAEGYHEWTKFYYESIKQPGKMKRSDALVKEINQAWHEFNFSRLDERSKELLDELKHLFNELKKKRDDSKD